MVKTLHQAGIEVILDVVYNHTAEGNHMGPTLSFKGIDNASYYRLVEDDKKFYMDYTGTGNTLNMRSPYVLQLVMDSLRYWATEMHVDGFRFDLASTLARSLHAVDRLSAFFDLVQQDPIVSQLKLIAEPWDVGDGGYQVGNFPPQWAEWNGKYRDCIRDHWAGAPHTLGEFAYRITGSSDLYEATGRRPHASINFVTAHDGFTMRDLVSYNEKHNEANGEDNNDGESHNRGWNCGAEGPTDDAEINALRARQSRNMIGTLLLSQGVPMILGGDEVGRTQQGNNNGYAQDNEISWYDWSNVDREMLEFTRQIVQFRREHHSFRRRRFFQGRQLRGAATEDLGWFTPTGDEMSEEQWSEAYAHAITLFMSGREIERDARGETVTDDDFLWMVNASPDDIKFTLPPERWGADWYVAIDTAAAQVSPADPTVHIAGSSFDVPGRSFVLLRRQRPDATG
jgi:glycogen operon protein